MTSPWRLEKPRNAMDRILSDASGSPERLEALGREPEDIPPVIGG
jgi:hypothetical protein